jgi:hypothetical protein
MCPPDDDAEMLHSYRADVHFMWWHMFSKFKLKNEKQTFKFYAGSGDFSSFERFQFEMNTPK